MVPVIVPTLFLQAHLIISKSFVLTVLLALAARDAKNVLIIILVIHLAVTARPGLVLSVTVMIT